MDHLYGTTAVGNQEHGGSGTGKLSMLELGIRYLEQLLMFCRSYNHDCALRWSFADSYGVIMPVRRSPYTTPHIAPTNTSAGRYGTNCALHPTIYLHHSLY